MKNVEVSKIVEVDGVILTEKAILRLKKFQDHDNESLDFSIQIIQRGIRTIVHNMDGYEADELKKIQNVLTDLSYVCDWIEDLEKP